MKRIVTAIIAALLLGSNVAAAIKISPSQARNMDDVMSLGVIYINHNIATESEADKALSVESDARGARLYYPILMHEPGSNGPLRTSAVIYR